MNCKKVEGFLVNAFLIGCLVITMLVASGRIVFKFDIQKVQRYIMEGDILTVNGVDYTCRAITNSTISFTRDDGAIMTIPLSSSNFALGEWVFKILAYEAHGKEYWVLLEWWQ